VKTLLTRFFPARVIARAARCCARTIKRRAAREGWPRRWRGNALEFVPPANLQSKCLKIPRPTSRDGLLDHLISPSRRAEVFRAKIRFEALCALETAALAGEPIERALVRVARDFTFHVSANSLRVWQRRFVNKGFSGLLENKRGHSGRKQKGQR
jgi:hypothetical protein